MQVENEWSDGGEVDGFEIFPFRNEVGVEGGGEEVYDALWVAVRSATYTLRTSMISIRSFNRLTIWIRQLLRDRKSVV